METTSLAFRSISSLPFVFQLLPDFIARGIPAGKTTRLLSGLPRPYVQLSTLCPTLDFLKFLIFPLPCLPPPLSYSSPSATALKKGVPPIFAEPFEFAQLVTFGKDPSTSSPLRIPFRHDPNQCVLRLDFRQLSPQDLSFFMNRRVLRFLRSFLAQRCSHS